MRTSLVTTLSTIALLTSCQPSLAQQSDFTKPGWYLGNPPCTEVECYPKPSWFSQLFSWTPSQPLPSRNDSGCTWQSVGKYNVPMLDCPTTPSSPDDDDRDNNRPYR